MDSTTGACNACGATETPLMKQSLGRDFFHRPYDRLSPSTDQSPKWYCERCSLHKHLQRDFRDIRAEFDKLSVGQGSELSRPEEWQRASLRLREILAILGSERSPLLAPADVHQLISRMQALAIPT